MDLPASPAVKIDAVAAMAEALGAPVQWTGRSDNRFLLALVGDERTVRELRPDIAAVARFDALGVIVTAAAAGSGQAYDFVSRVFAPNAGINEDPVTGSAHTVLAPYWADRLGRASLVGFQVSARSGVVGVESSEDRVLVIGRAVTVLDGVLSSAANPSSPGPREESPHPNRRAISTVCSRISVCPALRWCYDRRTATK